MTLLKERKLCTIALATLIVFAAFVHTRDLPLFLSVLL